MSDSQPTTATSLQIENALAELAETARERGCTPLAESLDAARCWATLVIEWRRAAQLTSLRQPEQVIRELMVPAIYALSVLDLGEDTVVADLGCGSGASGAALAAMSHKGEWWLVERSERKITFCRYALGRCRISGLEALTLAETLAEGTRADVVLTRALPPGRATAATVRQVLKPGGMVVKWVPGEKRPRGERVARCGDRSLWVVAEHVDVSRETMGPL